MLVIQISRRIFDKHYDLWNLVTIELVESLFDWDVFDNK